MGAGRKDGALPERLSAALSPVTIVCGHYGVGKTNFSVNLALDLARAGKHVTLVDMDVVNPYFRATEQREVLEAAGVALVAPVFAERGSSLDSPSLRGTIVPVIEQAYADEGGNTFAIVDAGGDDVGATALGRFAPVITKGDYAMVYVVNRSRNMTHTPEEAVAILREVEGASHLKVTAFVDNTHLKQNTTLDVLASSEQFCSQFAKISGLGMVGKTIPADMLQAQGEQLAEFKATHADVLYPINIVVKSPWE